MRQEPAKYGFSMGGFKPLEEQPVTISLRNSGINTSIAPSQLEEGEAVDAVDVRFTKGGVITDYGITPFGSAYAGAGLKNVLAIANYEIEAGTRYLLRMRPTAWDRWNGANWLTLGGVLTSNASDHYSFTTAEDTFVAANLKDRIKAWDGIDGNPVADLSADAPIAKYITRIGNRLLAAVIKVGALTNSKQVAWSADGNIRNWTNPNLGAGSAIPPAEGGDDTPNLIMGLSTIERGALIYRQRTLQLASLTGLGAAPFRFNTLDYAHGTESPQSISHGGILSGDYYLGYDYMPYHFDGQKTVPIGLPIHETLRDSILSLGSVLGGVDRNEQEYYIAYPDIAGLINQAWVFSIREYARSGKLVWRRKTLPSNTVSIGFGFLVSASDPIVDTYTPIVDTVSSVVDSFAITTGPDRMIFGSSVGDINRSDKTVLATTGTWTSKQYLFNGLEVLLDRVRVKYKATTAAQIIISVSTDSGITFGTPRTYAFGPTGSAEGELSQDFGVVARQVQFKIQVISGYVSISQLECTLQPRGRGNA